jgi:hypothetical protein
LRLVWRPGLEAAWPARRAYIERRHALGLKALGGRPSGQWWRKSEIEREGTLRMVEDTIAGLPAGPVDKPIEEWTPAELLSDTARLGLVRVREIVSKPISDDMDPQERRLIAEVGLGAARLLARVQEAAMRNADSEDWRGLLERLEKVKAAGRVRGSLV